MKSVLIPVLLSLAVLGCQNQNKTVETPTQVLKEQLDAYDEVDTSIDVLAKDILASFSTNNYASFSNYLSSKDTILTFVDKELKEASVTPEQNTNIKKDFGEEYTKRLTSSKTDFDFIIKKGTEDGIIWNNVNYAGTDWTLSKKKEWFGNFFSLYLDLKIRFKYKGVEHRIRFDGQPFLYLGGKWILMKDFYLDDFSQSDETAPATEKSVPSIPNVDSEEPMRDTSKMMMDNSQK